jgi:hypothetical protein
MDMTEVQTFKVEATLAPFDVEWFCYNKRTTKILKIRMTFAMSTAAYPTHEAE